MQKSLVPNLIQPTVCIGLSGGVDSAVSAYLLKQAGFKVFGLFMQNWHEEDSGYCNYQNDLKDIKSVCKLLDIPLKTINFSQEYWQNVFSVCLDEFKKGRTPNPDILCNQEIKFKEFYQHAIKLGADYIATGHYAKLDNLQLYKPKDLNKDQTYFLHAVKKQVFPNVLFPLANYIKPEVRKIATEINLVNHAKKDSTGICFIGERNFKEFLSDFLPAQPGDIVTTDGKKIAKHDGLMFYTLGQRKGLKIGGVKNAQEKPWFVVTKDLVNNHLIVTQDENHPAQFSSKLIAENFNEQTLDSLPKNFECMAKTRYRQPDQSCIVNKLEDNKLEVIFSQPQRAVTPGQSVVLYKDNLCLGGAIIQSTDLNNIRDF